MLTTLLLLCNFHTVFYAQSPFTSSKQSILLSNAQAGTIERWVAKLFPLIVTTSSLNRQFTFKNNVATNILNHHNKCYHSTSVFYHRYNCWYADQTIVLANSFMKVTRIE
ncbi:MAG: hypothetical protein JNL32_10240 [Candidatus Kapabacteria bacterium]|nr:hypothetical protein [Candidatus Kapabacteria bacterium]